MPPTVSVVMPVYNGERFLREAIESILSQTFKDFEFIIVNDGSVDSTENILEHYKELDTRIQIHSNEGNQGIISSLNTGCQLAQGKYIARMDADDISMQHRFEKQVEYLDANSDVTILGTAAEIIDENNRSLGYQILPSECNTTRWFLIFGNCLMHPTVMIRREPLELLKYYNPQAYGAEDYDLWVRASDVAQLNNLSDVLFKYRVWSFSTTAQISPKMEERSIEIVTNTVSKWLNSPISSESAANLRFLKSPAWGESPNSQIRVHETHKTLERLYQVFLQSVKLTPTERRAISTDLALRYYRLALCAWKFSILDTVRLGVIGFRHSPASITRLFQALRKRLL